MLYNQDTQTSSSTDSETDIINDRSRSSGYYTRTSPHHYCIVESWIPGGTGVLDYYEFMALRKQREKLNKEYEDLHLNDDESTRDNPAFRITAALSNISQLISVASDILDIRLPKKQKYFDFYTAYDCYKPKEPELFPSENELLHRAAKLNANIIYLCLSQNVHFDFLNPSSTGKNLNAFFDANNSNLGRTGPISIPQDVSQVIEDCLLPNNNLYTDFEDFEFIEEGDWEAVPRSSVINIPHDNQSTINSESILTNLAETWYNAVTSFIRG
uniref:Uncharacterized protein n=2 Tax=Tetranychus urticae TaxID=32264 RepID=T1KH70_TETUR